MLNFPAVLLAARGSDWDGIPIVQIIVIAIFIGGPFLIKLIKKAQNNPPNPSQPASTAAEDNERIRRIREEVARRVAQQRGSQPQVQEAPPPVPTTSGQRTAPPPRTPRPEPTPPAVPVMETSFEQTENSRAMLAELETAKRSILESQQKAKALLQATADKSSATVLFQPSPSSSLDNPSAKDLLRDKKALRTAIVASELLAPPLALRDNRDPLRRK